MATTTLPASLSTLSAAATPHHTNAASKTLTLTLAANSNSKSFSLLHSSPPRLLLAASASRRWRLLASPDEEAPQTLEAEEVVEAAPAMPVPVEAQLAEAAGAEAAKGEDVFAVVMIGSRQYIVFPGRYIYTQRLKGANVNDQISQMLDFYHCGRILLNKVLLVGTRTKAYIGQPIVTNAAVHAVVEEQGLDDKVIIFKYKKKKKYRRKIGHRQPNTRIRITGISGYEDFPAETMPETVPA